MRNNHLSAVIMNAEILLYILKNDFSLYFITFVNSCFVICLAFKKAIKDIKDILIEQFGKNNQIKKIFLLYNRLHETKLNIHLREREREIF